MLSSSLRCLRALLASVLVLSPLAATADIVIMGGGSYSCSGFSCTVKVDRIENTSTTTTSGDLRVALWATKKPMTATSINGTEMLDKPLRFNDGTSFLRPGEAAVNVRLSDGWNKPAPGIYYVYLVVDERNAACTDADGFCFVDSMLFPEKMVVVADLPPSEDDAAVWAPGLLLLAGLLALRRRRAVC